MPFAGYTQNRFEAGIGGLLNVHMLNYDNNNTTDSLKNLTKMRLTAQGGFKVNFKINRQFDMQIGLGYNRFSSKFERTGLNFHDSIHPAIGRIEDLSQGASKAALYWYNFDYLSIPLNFMYRIDVRKGAGIYTPYFVFGVQNDILVNHMLKVETRGFTMLGENVHKIKDSRWAPTDYVARINLGGRFEIKLDKLSNIVLQPEIKVAVNPSATAQPKVYQHAAGIWVGLTRKIGI